MKLFTFLTLLLISVSTYLSSQEKTFTFKGQVHAYGKPIKGAMIEVFTNGDLVVEAKTKGGGKFDFELEAEKQFMMEVSMDNMRGKTIWINTKKTKNVNKVPAFAFDVFLKKEKITAYDELSEIPVTYIKYQSEKKEFYMDETYAELLKNKKKKIKENRPKIR